MPASTPDNETSRLDWLRQSRLLDTPPEKIFDEAARLAARVCGVPVAAVSLIDADRQWYKAVVGTDLVEMPRDAAFCAHTILQADTLIVPDLSRDERFRDNPLVAGGPSVRFYAGAPMVTSEGFALGSVCVVDRVPRELTEDQQAVLETLAHQLVTQIELQRRAVLQNEMMLQMKALLSRQEHLVAAQTQAQEATQRSERRLRLALESANLGSFEVNLYTGQFLEVSAIYKAHFGLAPDAQFTAKTLFALIHPEDRERIAALVGQSKATEQGFQTEHRVIWPDGSLHWLSVYALLTYDGAGQPAYMIGVLQDITARKQTQAAQEAARQALHQSEQELQAVVDQAMDGVYLFDPHTRKILKTNAAWRNMLGYSEAQAAALSLYDIVAHDRNSVDRNVEKVLSEREVFVGERQYRRRDGEMVLVEVNGRLVPHNGTEAFCVNVHDVTERRKSERALQAEREFQRALLESLQGGILACDAGGRITLINGTARRWHGLSQPTSLMERLPEGFDLYHWDGITPMQAEEMPLTQAFHGKTVVDAQVVIASKNAPSRFVHVNGQPMHDAGGNKIGAVVAIRDVTEQKQIEDGQRMLLEAGTLLSETLDYEATLTRVAQMAVPSLADLCFFDLRAEDGSLKRYGWADKSLEHGDAAAAFAAMIQVTLPQNSATHPISRVLQTGQPVFVPFVTEDWMQSAASPQYLSAVRQLGIVSLMSVPLTAHGTVIGALTLCFTTSGRHHSSSQLTLARLLCNRAALAVQNARLYQAAVDRADHDPLTELLNHRAFHKRMQDETARTRREHGSLAVVMLDLDGFKFFNDVYGHLVGDGVLRQVAKRLQSVCRSYDTVARFGGDEFALLLPNVGEATPAEIESRIRTDLGDMSFELSEYPAPIPITVSVGAAIISMETQDRDEALRQADERLLRSKTGGATEADAVRAAAKGDVAGFSMLDALVTAVNNKDRYTSQHSEDVMDYSLRMAREMNLSAAQQQTVAVAALLHDVGKIGVPDSILRKPGRLTEEEFSAIQQHPRMGASIVSTVPGLEGTLDAVRHHHERWDGGGYPQGLRGEEIPLMARLMAVADAYSAMTTDRPYRKGMDAEKARSLLRDGSGTQWDPRCVDAFLRAAHPT